MMGLLSIALVAGVIWLIYKLQAPWRAWHAEHIAPLEKEREELVRRRGDVDKARQQAEDDAALYSRNFAAEQARLEAMIARSHKEMKALQGQKTALHNEQSEVMEDLDAWHRKSRAYFGNGGRELPQDSFLGIGQSLSDRDNLKEQRDELGERILSTKTDISSLNDQIGRCKAAIRKIVSDQRRLASFRKMFVGPAPLRREAELHTGKLADVDAEIANVDAAIADATTRFKDRSSRK
jgi:chromosome segregation ATPase